MARTRELKVKITGDEKDLSRAFGSSDKATSKWGKALSTFGKAAALGLAGVGVAAVKFGLDFVHAAEESVKIGKQTAAVIKSTGGAAGVTAVQVGKLAEQLSLKAGIDDELIQSGANVLLTFTNIRNEVGKGNDIFDQATTAALDMSVALGQDMQSSVIQLGKALNDPIKGITALQRVGVAFTDQQKEQIKTLVESGDTLGAQKVILAELTKEFGGSAEAQATATDKLKVAFGNVSEQIGMVLLPYVNQFSDWLVAEGIPLIRDQFIPWLRDSLLPAVQDLAHWIGEELLPDLKDMGATIRDDVLPTVQHLTEALVAMPTAVQIALASLGVLAKFGGFGLLAGAATAMSKVIATAFGFIGFAATLAWNIITRTVPFAHLIALALLFRNQLSGVFAAVGRVAASAFSAIAGFASRTFANLQNWAATAVRAIGGFFQRLPGQIAGALSGIAGIFGRAMSSAYGTVSRWVGQIVDLIWSIPSKIAGIAGSILDKLPSPGGGVPFIPGIATGGIVMPNGIQRFAAGGFAGTDTVPAMLTPGEMVLNRSQQRALFANGGGSTIINVSFAGAIISSERQAEQWVSKALSRALGKDTRAVTVRGQALL